MDVGPALGTFRQPGEKAMTTKTILRNLAVLTVAGVGADLGIGATEAKAQVVVSSPSYETVYVPAQVRVRRRDVRRALRNAPVVATSTTYVTPTTYVAPTATVVSSPLATSYVLPTTAYVPRRYVASAPYLGSYAAPPTATTYVESRYVAPTTTTTVLPGGYVPTSAVVGPAVPYIESVPSSGLPVIVYP